MFVTDEAVSSSRDAPPVRLCPWLENPYELVSLFEMLTPFGTLAWINSNLLTTATWNMANIADDLECGNSVSEDRRKDRLKHAKSSLECQQAMFSRIGMPVSLDKVKELLRRIDADPPNDHRQFGLLSGELQTLGRTIGTELRAHKFLYVSPEKQMFYESDPPPPLVLAVTDHFDEAVIDATEACRCFALSRNTACVFHCMRVLEVGVQAISKAAGLIDPRPNWDPVIRRVDSLLKMDSDHLKRNTTDRVPEIHDNRDFYAGCSAHFHAIKIAWRNRVMHVERSYSEEDAIGIVNATRGLMEHLGMRLGKSAQT